ncbi:AbrB/MazE/SpoVT family DNA-binding domain-containing protein [Candidatus Rariloculus sp.]|uniref:AbrB/MazE/SpoVT family DNA-binding domain-containing protein n=1 Tax=Candidatus Rariloculus sp. TaxID=3101265 RepID=UPI003D0C1F7C
MAKATAVRNVKLIAIGNSRGIRLPKGLLQKYGWRDSLVLEETEDGILLYSKEKNKLSWEDTYRAMAADNEDWSDLDAAVADGLD